MWAPIPALPLASCVTSGIMLKFSGLQLLHRKRDNNNTSHTGIFESVKTDVMLCLCLYAWQ